MVFKAKKLDEFSQSVCVDREEDRAQATPTFRGGREEKEPVKRY